MMFRRRTGKLACEGENRISIVCNRKGKNRSEIDVMNESMRLSKFGQIPYMAIILLPQNRCKKANVDNSKAFSVLYYTRAVFMSI